MIDLERELRATLEGRARLAPPPFETRPAIRVARRRQLGMILTALAVVAAVVAGSIAGVSVLIRSSERRIPAGPPDAFSAGSLEAVLIGSFGFYDLTVDINGAVWWSGSGLTRFDPDSGAIQTFTDNAFSDARIALAPDGAPWAATASGLFRFDGSGWQQVASGEHTAIAFAPDGKAWTVSGGADTVRSIGGPALPGPIPVPLSVGPRFSLALGPGAEVWVGTLSGWFPTGGGLAHFDGEVWESVDPFPKGARVHGVVDIQVTAEDSVWVSFRISPSKNAGYGLVVMRYQNGAWTEFREGDGGIHFDGGGDLASTPDGTLLLATRNGLFAFHDGSWKSVVGGSFDELSVAPDGTIWLAGDEGLFRLADA